MYKGIIIQIFEKFNKELHDKYCMPIKMKEDIRIMQERLITDVKDASWETNEGTVVVNLDTLFEEYDYEV